MGSSYRQFCPVALVRVWRGDLGWSAALRSGDLTLDGVTSLPRWFTLSAFAAVPRPATR